MTRPCRRRWVGLLGALVAVCAGRATADDTAAASYLLKGDQGRHDERLGEAWNYYDLAYGHAASNYLRVEALACMAAITREGSRERALQINKLMAIAETCPPRWLSDPARKIWDEQIAQRVASGQFPSQPSDPGVRTLELASAGVGSGFKGARYLWMTHLGALPGPDVQVDGVAIDTDTDRMVEAAARVALPDGGSAFLDPRHAQEGRYSPEEQAKWRFDRCLVGYTFEPIYATKDILGHDVWAPTTPWHDDQQGIWRLRFRVFYPSRTVSAGARYDELAENLCDALLRGHWLGREYLGREATDGDRRPVVLNVWLTPNPADVSLQAGGERWLDNLYFYDITSFRAPGEWLREALHEYSHAMMPRLGSYTGSNRYEQWLEGNLGERLLLKFLDDNLRGVADDKLPELLRQFRLRNYFATYQDQQWDPLVSIWLSGGPTSVYQHATDDTGAAWLLGFALWLVETNDPALVRDVFAYPAPSAQLNAEDLVRTYSARLSEEERPSFGLRPGRSVVVVTDSRPVAKPEGLELSPDAVVAMPAWLPHERWKVRVLSAAGGIVTVQLDEGERRLLETGTTVDTAPALELEGEGRWHRLRLGGFGDKPPVVQKLVFERRLRRFGR